MKRSAGLTLYAMFAIAATLAVAVSARAADVPSETVHFENDYATSLGESVFVLGNTPELGMDDMTRAVKLVPHSGGGGSLLWTIDIAIPQGTSYSFQYAVRSDAIEDLSDPANGWILSGPFVGQTTTPTPPTRDLTIFGRTIDNVTHALFDTPTGTQAVPFLPVPGYPEYVAANLPDQPNGIGITAELLGRSFTTPLHRIFVRANISSSHWLYSYVPTSHTDLFGVKTEHAIPTALIAHTRVVDSVSGRGVVVWTPRAYEDHADRHYPVLYMHDGQNVFVPGGPFGSWQAEYVAAQLISEGQIREMIIVGIDNSNDRLIEYNPDWPGSINANYNSFVANELKPFIDANYRTLPAREATGIMGSSFGGIASLSLGLDYPGVFGQVGAMSTSFWATTLDNRLANGELPMSTRLYLDAGDINDGGDDTTAVRDALLDTGRVLQENLFFQIGYGHQHNEAAWHARLPTALRALFPIWETVDSIDLPVPIPGDIDGDCDVDLADLGALLGAYDTCIGDPGYSAAADIDNSGCVNLSDLSLLLASYGTTDCD